MAKISWVASKAGIWTTPGNWSPAQVPGAADDVLFDGGGADQSFVGTQTVTTLILDDPTTLLSVSGLLTVLDDLMINAGTLSIGSGAGVVLTNFSNQGTIILDSGASLTATGNYTADSVERIGGAGGTLRLSGAFDNVGNTLTLASAGPTIREFGTIIGGTIVGEMKIGVGVTATVDGLTVRGGIAFEGGAPLNVANGLVVTSADGANPGTVSLRFSGGLNFIGDQTFDAAELNFLLGHSPIRAGGTLTLGSAVTMQAEGYGGVLSLEGTDASSAIVNSGSINLQSHNASTHGFTSATIDVSVARFENHGAMSVSHFPESVGRITITSTKFTNTAGGVLSVAHVPLRLGFAEIAVSGTTAFTNDGSIFANGGSIDLAPTLLGSGDVLITNGGTVDLHNGSAVEQTVMFGDRGVLELENAALFAGTITGVTQNTSVLLNVSATAIAYTTNVLTMRLAGGQTFGLTIVGDNLTLDNFIVNSGASATSISTNVASPPCFVTGTRIWTDTGEIPVEILQIGDRVRLASGAEPKPIVWIGQRHVSCATHPNPRQVWPVRIAANAFAPDQPARDLFLSPDHALFIDDVLIPVKHLINDQTITQVPTETVTYYHVELASHDVILAEGLPVESYLDTGDRTSFANADIVTTLFPTFGPQTDHNLAREAHAIAPLVVSGPILRAVRQRLAPNMSDLVTAEAEPRRLTRRQSPHRGTPLKQPQQHPHRTPAL